MEIKAPNDYQHLPRPWIFLSGSIEMGKAEEWMSLLLLVRERPRDTKEKREKGRHNR